MLAKPIYKKCKKKGSGYLRHAYKINFINLKIDYSPEPCISHVQANTISLKLILPCFIRTTIWSCLTDLSASITPQSTVSIIMHSRKIKETKRPA